MKARISESEQAEIITYACQKLELDGHIKWIRHKIDCDTWAEKIANTFRRNFKLPVKNSYMYCDTLDMCFFFLPESGTACVSYSGYTTANSNDLKKNLKVAFEKAELVLTIMQEQADLR